MAFDANGVFTMPAGATTATPGAVIASATWNSIHGEIQTALTDLGQGCPYTLSASGVAVPLTGGTGETALATIAIAAGTLGANGVLRISAYWSYTNNGNNKTFRVRLGGISGTAFSTSVTTTAISTRLQLEIWNRNSAAVQVATNAGGSPTTGTVNTAVAQDLVLSGQLANGGDTMTLEGYIIEAFRRT